MLRFQALSAAMLAGAVALPLVALSGTANAQSYGNGYNNANASQQRLRCDSKEGRQNFCRPNIQANQIQMVRRFSKNQCINGQTYGLTRDGMIWVNGGCRADFVVTQSRRGGRNGRGNAYGYGQNSGNGYGNHSGYGTNSGYGNQSGYGQTFRCESNDGRQNFCNVNVSSRGSVQMVKQLSKTPCINGRTWGVEGNGVWVNNGCRAEFVIGR